MPRDKIVYLWLDKGGNPKYVGMGTTKRGHQHPDGTHNAELRELLKNSQDIKTAGPYTQREAELVESALITALGEAEGRSLFNKSPGNGLKFRRPGVPEDKAHRLWEPPLSASQICEMAGSVLFLSTEKTLPAESMELAVEEIAHRVACSWQLAGNLRLWQRDPSVAPRLAVGLSGTPKRRLVLGAFSIDPNKWDAAVLELKRPELWRIPIADPSEPDPFELQGRRVVDVTFQQGKHANFRWYLDGELKPYRGNNW